MQEFRIRGKVRRDRMSVWTLKYITGTCDTEGRSLEVSIHFGTLISISDSHLSLPTVAGEMVSSLEGNRLHQSLRRAGFCLPPRRPGSLYTEHSGRRESWKQMSSRLRRPAHL